MLKTPAIKNKLTSFLFSFMCSRTSGHDEDQNETANWAHRISKNKLKEIEIETRFNPTIT